VTGVASNGTYTYVLGDDYYGDPLVEYFNSSGYVQANPYMQDLPALPSHYDIGYEGGDGTGDIWVATDAADSPVKAYDTGNMLVGYIPEADLPSGTQPRGLCFDTDGYLWISDENANKIYKIDFTTDIGGGSVLSFEQAVLTVSANPFSESVTISVIGALEPVDLAIYDLSGRTVLRTELAVSASFIWNGKTAIGEIMPLGTYIIRATSPAGQVMRMLVTKL